MIEIVFGGGAGEIGGPNFCVVKAKNRIIAIDCGLGHRISDNKEGKKEETVLPDFGIIDGKLSGLFVTHGHLDHVGAVPCIIEKVRLSHDFGIYMSLPTWEFARMHWNDTLRMAERNNAVPPFFLKNIEISKSYAECVKPGYAFEMNNFKVRAFTGGHILGALGYLMEIDGKKIFITGDFSTLTYPLIRPADFDFLKKMGIDVLITESTYAGRELPSFSEELLRFEKDVANFLKKRMSILIPAFAIDRAQKIYWVLKKTNLLSAIRGQLFIDGNARKASKIYQKYTEDWLTDIENYFVFKKNGSDYRSHNSRGHRNIKLDMDDLRRMILKNKPCIVIASSGMVFENSISNWYAAELAENNDAAILLTGYQALGSPGAEIKSAKNGEKVFLGGRERTLNAKVKSYCFTAHAREHEIARTIEMIRPKNVIFYHGEPGGTRSFLAKYPNLPGKKFFPKNGETLKI